MSGTCPLPFFPAPDAFAITFLYFTMTKDRVLQLIQDSFDSLKSAELITMDIEVDENTMLLGPSSVLDSIAFVTFMVELEDRLQEIGGQDSSVFSLAINEIHEFNPDDAMLTAGTLADYVIKTSAVNG
jgi:acyl carrier protein